MIHRRFRARWAGVAALLFLAACARSDGPRVEAYADGAWQEVDFTRYDITGRRDGGTTHASATFTFPDGERLVVGLDVIYDPTPSLGTARWNLEGAAPASGIVHAEAVKFLGGQGGGPSVGGRFRLEEDGVPRFRVVLPARPVEKTDWGDR